MLASSALFMVDYLPLEECYDRFVEQKLVLCSKFRYDQTHNCQKYDFGHTLAYYLSRTQMFNKPTSKCAVHCFQTLKICFSPRKMFIKNSVYLNARPIKLIFIVTYIFV